MQYVGYVRTAIVLALGLALSVSLSSGTVQAFPAAEGASSSSSVTTSSDADESLSPQPETSIRAVLARSLARADEEKAAPPIVQQAVMVKDRGPFRLKMTKYRHRSHPYRQRIEKAAHRVRLRVYKLKERVRKWNYYFLSMDTSRIKKKTRVPFEKTDGSWMSYIAWTPHKVRTAYTKRRVATTGGCKSYPLNLGVAFFGISAGTRVGSAKMCSGKARIDFEHTKSTAGRGGHYTAYSPRGVKSAEFRKFIKVKRGHTPKFRVRLGAHCDSIHRPTHSPVIDTCYKYRTVRY